MTKKALLFALVLSVFMSCSHRRLDHIPDHSEVSVEDWRLVSNRFTRLVRERSNYHKLSSGPKPLRIICFEKDPPYFFIAAIVETNENSYLYRIAGALDEDRIAYVQVGDWNDKVEYAQGRYIESAADNGDFAPLFGLRAGSIEQIDFETVRHSIHYWDQYDHALHGLKNTYGRSLARMALVDTFTLVVSDTTLNVITLSSLVKVGIPNHIISRIDRSVRVDVSLSAVYGARKIRYPWFAEKLIVTLDENTHRTSIVGYVGRNGISYRLAPSFSELIDSLSINPDANISIVPYDRYGPAITPWLDADSMSRMYESYDIGPDDDTLYIGEYPN